jgi:hypothetical protein
VIRAPWPIGQIVYKTMVNRIGVDVMYNIGELVVAGNFFSLEVRDEQAALAGVHFVIGFGIRVEKVAELLGYSFFYNKTSKVFLLRRRNLGGLKSCC